ncbi:hypothetical protein QTP88_018692 [Uroleucon formosanum]
MDWEAFRTQLVNHIDLKTRLKSTQDIDDAVHTLTTSIQQAAWSSSTIPNPLNKPTSDLPHFVRTLISEKRKARAVWQRTKYPSDKRLFNHLTNKLKRILAKIKSDNITNHLASLSTTDNSLWQNTRKILRSQPPVPPLRNPDGTWLISDLEKTNAFRHHLYTTFQPHIDIIPSNKIVDVDHFLSSPLPMTLPPKHIRPSEVEFIINKSARHKTPGYDLITSEVASQLPRKAILSLTHIYNSILRLSYFPLLWKFSIIIMILKPGKPADSPSSYRPISLLPFFSKVFEKLTLKRLLPIIDTNLPDNQFGFRNNYSTIHQVHRIVDKISYSLEKKLICTGAFLDVAQAFKVNISSQLLLNLQVISRRQAFLPGASPQHYKMFTKPPALKSPSIRQPPYSKDVQKQKNKTSPTTPKNLPKPNSLKITSNPKPLHQMLPKNSPNVNTSTSSINTDINKQSFASTVEPIHNTALRLSIGAFKSSPVLSIISITGSKSLEKRRIKHTLEYSSKTLIATKNPISTILRNSINQFQNNDINNLGTRTATYASDLNISFTNQLNPQASEQPPWITSNLLIYFNLTAHKKKRNQFLHLQIKLLQSKKQSSTTSRNIY